MLAQPLRMPEERRLIDRPGWLFERKLDGLRCLAVRNGGALELWSRNRLPFTPRFPEIVAALTALPVDNFTLDGELVAFEGNRTSFALLQRPQPGTSPEFHVFDLLHLLGHDTTGLPLADRRRLLEQALDGVGAAVHVVETFEGDAQLLLDEACAAGWEGIIGKRKDRPYRSGRSPDWRKLKCSISQELVVGGWSDPSGSRIGLGALLVGYYDDGGQLQYAGKVGTGLDDRELADLRRLLDELAIDHSPFAGPPARIKGAHWARPQLVVAVDFTEWTNDGRLRHPRFGGLRLDKSPADVRRERPAP
jgi:bifunctional non-homologous end joining protein LigD